MPRGLCLGGRRGKGRVSRTVVLSPHLFAQSLEDQALALEIQILWVWLGPCRDVLKAHPERLMCRRAESPACVMVSWWGSWELGHGGVRTPPQGQEYFFFLVIRSSLCWVDSSGRHLTQRSAGGCGSWCQNLKGLQPAT